MAACSLVACFRSERPRSRAAVAALLALDTFLNVLRDRVESECNSRRISFCFLDPTTVREGQSQLLLYPNPAHYVVRCCAAELTELPSTACGFTSGWKVISCCLVDSQNIRQIGPTHASPFAWICNLHAKRNRVFACVRDVRFVFECGEYGRKLDDGRCISSCF